MNKPEELVKKTPGFLRQRALSACVSLDNELCEIMMMTMEMEVTRIEFQVH